MYRAMTGSTAPFIVIETLIVSSGMPSNSTRMSRMESIATPAMPTSPATRVVGVVAAVGGEVEAMLRPFCPARGCAGRRR